MKSQKIKNTFYTSLFILLLIISTLLHQIEQVGILTKCFELILILIIGYMIYQNRIQTKKNELDTQKLTHICKFQESIIKRLQSRVDELKENINEKVE